MRRNRGAFTEISNSEKRQVLEGTGRAGDVQRAREEPSWVV